MMRATKKQFEAAIKALGKAYVALGPIVLDERLDADGRSDHAVVRLRREIAEYESLLDNATWWRN